MCKESYADSDSNDPEKDDQEKEEEAFKFPTIRVALQMKT